MNTMNCILILKNKWLKKEQSPLSKRKVSKNVKMPKDLKKRNISRGGGFIFIFLWLHPKTNYLKAGKKKLTSITGECQIKTVISTQIHNNFSVNYSFLKTINQYTLFSTMLLLTGKDRKQKSLMSLEDIKETWKHWHLFIFLNTSNRSVIDI